VTGSRRREPALDFLSAIEGGVVGRPDPEVLSIAADLGRILVTHDRNTMPGHIARFLETRTLPGVIVLFQEIEIGVAIEELLLICVATEANEWVGHLGFIPV
jgi:hypothetical protein